VVVSSGLISMMSVTVTLPIPWSIVTVVAFIVLQERIEEPFSIIVDGFAVKDIILGRTTGVVGNLQLDIDKNKDKHKKHKSIFLIILPPFIQATAGKDARNLARGKG